MYRTSATYRSLSRLHNSLRSSRHQHTVSSPPPFYQIWAANTDLGKTVLSAALLRNTTGPSLFLKPVQSGYPADDDSSLVHTHAPHAHAVTLHTLGPALSPDLAAQVEGSDPLADEELRRQVQGALAQFLLRADGSPGGLGLVETAGGVLSPVPSGSLQADAYRALRMPAVLVGDGKLGGISATLAAYEALKLRGYDVPVVVFFKERDGSCENEASVETHVKDEGTSVFQAPELPPRETPLEEYMRLPETGEFFGDLGDYLKVVEEKRFQALRELHEESGNVFWYPFTQHAQLKDVTVIDSAHGDSFECYSPQEGLHPMVDGIGSWWTNGTGHGDARLAKAIGGAVGRYGHVMFAEATNEPAYQLAKGVLDGAAKGWGARVFYSDDGSTAVEVALKMAFRKRREDFPERCDRSVRVVALEGCYHGDTLGVMDCAPASDFNTGQTPWYTARGEFFEPPTAGIVDGVWRVRMPAWTEMEDVRLSGEAELFDHKRTVAAYDEKIAERLDGTMAQGVELGALLVEPVLQGAGGMRVVDPAFQRALVRACRSRRIPVVFDEVFTGLWRLGAESGAAVLGETPDIATYGKLLTGGTVPLAMTVASEAVFSAFRSGGKKGALLHGHSYTAHAAGCAAGVASLRIYARMEGRHRGDYWDAGMVRELSCVGGVREVTVVGTVLAVRVGEGGYAGTGAGEMVRRLGREGVFARPLGDVVYVMCTPVTRKEVCDEIIGRVFKVVTEVAEGGGEGEGQEKGEEEGLEGRGQS